MLENILEDALCFLNVWSAKCLNWPIVKRAHAPRQRPPRRRHMGRRGWEADLERVLGGLEVLLELDLWQFRAVQTIGALR